MFIIFAPFPSMIRDDSHGWSLYLKWKNGCHVTAALP